VKIAFLKPDAGTVALNATRRFCGRLSDMSVLACAEQTTPGGERCDTNETVIDVGVSVHLPNVTTEGCETRVHDS